MWTYGEGSVVEGKGYISEYITVIMHFDNFPHILLISSTAIVSSVGCFFMSDIHISFFLFLMIILLLFANRYIIVLYVVVYKILNFKETNAKPIEVEKEIPLASTALIVGITMSKALIFPFEDFLIQIFVIFILGALLPWPIYLLESNLIK